MDIKANGLVSLPPSMHESSVRYKWIVPLPETVAELPLLDPLAWNLEDFPDGKDGNDGKEGNDGTEGIGKVGLRVSLTDLKPKTQTAIHKAIEKTLPKAFGQRYGLIWRCCRHLLAIEEIKHKSWDEIKIIGDIWHKKAQANIEHKSLTMTQARFKNAWDEVKYPVGEGNSLEIAKEAAFSSTELMPEFELYEGDETMHKLIRLCFELQRLAGLDDWFIPTRKGKDLFGLSHSWLGTLLEDLQAKKFIKKTKVHTRYKCARYKYIGQSVALL